MTGFRALCAELVEKLDELNCHYNVPSQSAMIERACAALADEPAVPQPQPPAEGEVGDRVAWLRRFAAVDWIADETADKLYAIADILSQHHPAPVPVSERLPGPEDCDAEGRCWVWWKNGVRWVLDEWTHHELREGQLSDCVSHWLPAHALPLPSGEVE